MSTPAALPMASVPPARTTELLTRLAQGDREAGERVLPIVVEELRRLAQHHLAGTGSPSIQPTALVNEAWLRLVDRPDVAFEARAQFYSLASRVMRSVLVDRARERAALKRGGEGRRVTLRAADADRDAGGDASRDGRNVLDVLALDEALEGLAARDPALVEIVELRFFGGLSHPTIAELTGTPLRTVERRWRLARAFLHGELA